MQPYEGFVNYRWLASLSGEKLGGSWFDHIECTDKDFIDQAYQSVLAGSKELTLFNYFNFTQGHPGHHLLRMEFEHLADLARAVAQSPVHGVSAYKPPNSDAGGDLYVMDFIGMYGVPIVPTSIYPRDSKVIFLPTQAATDPNILIEMKRSLDNGSRIILTSGFLANAYGGQEIAAMAGLDWPIVSAPINSESILDGGEAKSLELGLDLETGLISTSAKVLLEAISGENRIPFLCQNQDQNIFVLNSHTFSQKDFDAVGEVLLCPRPLGMLNLPASWANLIREVFNSKLGIAMEAPTRVALQPFGEQEIMVQNYNDGEINAKITVDQAQKFIDVFTGQPLAVIDGVINLPMPSRSRVWMKPR